MRISHPTMLNWIRAGHLLAGFALGSILAGLMMSSVHAARTSAKRVPPTATQALRGMLGVPRGQRPPGNGPSGQILGVLRSDTYRDEVAGDIRAARLSWMASTRWLRTVTPEELSAAGAFAPREPKPKPSPTWTPLPGEPPAWPPESPFPTTTIVVVTGGFSSDFGQVVSDLTPGVTAESGAHVQGGRESTREVILEGESRDEEAKARPSPSPEAAGPGRGRKAKASPTPSRTASPTSTPTPLPPPTLTPTPSATPSPLPAPGIPALDRDFPASLRWDAPEESWMSEVRRQQGCNACAAFAVVGALEAQCRLLRGRPWVPLDYSEQDVFACVGGSCSRGTTYQECAEHIIRAGIATEFEVPYAAEDTACMSAPRRATVLFDAPPVTAPGEISRVKLKRGLMQGPVVTYIVVYTDLYLYDSGVYARTSSGVFDGYHAVVLAGWDDERRAWRVRNSWGDWGESGSGWIRYDQEIGADAMQVIAMR